MHIIHASDWHLGHELHGFDRGFEHDAFLGWLLGQLVELKADALIVTGDIYDAVNPPVAAQQRLYRFVKRVLEYIPHLDRKSTRLNSSHQIISYAVFCLKKKKTYM